MDIEFEGKKGTGRLLIISYDIIGKQMAGPGIRFYEFAKILSNYIDVTLAAPTRIDINTEGFRAVTYNTGNFKTLKRYTEISDIILIQGHILHYFPFLKNYKGRVIVDLYNPFNLESLEMFRNNNMAERMRIDKNNIDLLKFQLGIGDFFICASEKQRDYWLGMLNAMGRINPFNYDWDDTLKKLIDIVPFGIPSTPPQHTGEGIRKFMPAIREDDLIVLWGGGVWNWLDPITVIKAIWEITRNRKDIKLVFSGIKHPDPKLPEMKKCIDAINLSKELDLYDKFVFFNEWTPYEIRQNFLLESNAGLSIHLEKIETEFAYRTRVMDYIWAKLPIITTEGDSIAKMVKDENIGEVVKYGSTHQLARVIESMLVNKSLKDIYRKNLEKITPRFYWENVTKPLINYCLEADYASDKKKIVELIDVQNSKISNIIKSNFSGATNILVLTSNLYQDKDILKSEEIGKVFYLEVDSDPDNLKADLGALDKVGVLKSKILSRTRFDGVIINNTFKRINPKFFYDLLNVVGMKLKTDGILFFSVPENRGLLKSFAGEKNVNRTGERMDEFTIEFMFKNTGYEIVSKGTWDKIEFIDKEKEPEGKTSNYQFQDLYGKNELLGLYEIKLSRKDFKELTLLKGLNILESEEFVKDKSLKGKIRKYMYLLTSLYFENLRKSYNSSMQAINNNIQLQINRELNELNFKNRERMIFIYYNIFKTLERQISNLSIDTGSIRGILKGMGGRCDDENNVLDERLEVLLGDLDNLDRIMGLTLSNKYYIAKKL
ncbi:MAG: glycosyltransferase family 4 protein [Actinobacteria bacterium]|nr:glycosyltransferase family 4 protein [Actinomycetota bacterium]